MNIYGDSYSISPDSGPDDPSKDLDSVGAKCIELYQNQTAQTDRLWAYFSQYGAMIIILGCLLALYRASEQVRALPRWALFIPLAIYLVFIAGNNRALSQTLDELQIIRGIAVTKTRYTFKGSNKGTIVRYQLLLALLVSIMYVMAVIYAW